MQYLKSALAPATNPQAHCKGDLSLGILGRTLCPILHFHLVGKGMVWFRRALTLSSAAAVLGLVACANQSGSLSLQRKPLSGYVRMKQVQAAYLGSGNAGSGVLYYQGSRYPFSVGGLGVGGI